MAILKYRKKIGSGYRAFIQVSPVKQVTKCFERKIDAEAWEADQKKLFRNGHSIIVPVTVGEFAETWLTDIQARKSFATYQRYEGVLRIYILPTFGKIKLSELDPFLAEQWQLKMARTLSPKTVNAHVLVLQKLLNDAVRWRKLACNPISSVRPLTEPEQEFRFLTMDEIAQLLTSVRGRNSVAFAVFAIAALTGMRLAEIQGLKWDCISFQIGKITVKRIWDSKARCLKETTKTKTIRVIPISKDLKAILIPMAAGKATTDFLFEVGERQGGFNFHGAARVLKAYCRHAGVQEVRFHDLRHSFASNFVMAGGNIYDLQRMLGHASVTMTERYSHFSPDHLNGATDILNYGLGGTGEVISLRRAKSG
jgi:integrase